MTSKVWDRPIDTLATVPRYKPKFNLSDEYFKDDQVLNTSEYTIDAIAWLFWRILDFPMHHSPRYRDLQLSIDIANAQQK